MKKEYDYLVVGAGLFGAVFAHEAALAGKRCLVIDKRNHAGGNIYCQETEGIQVHAYGAHIFHTDQAEIWEYANRFVRFNRFTNAPLARYRDELYNLPFNMNTFHQLWGVKTPAEARARLAVECEKYAYIETPANLEEQALKLGGKDIYERLIKGYTEKQWGRSARELPAFIIRRLPFRFTFDNNYFKASKCVSRATTWRIARTGIPWPTGSCLRDVSMPFSITGTDIWNTGVSASSRLCWRYPTFRETRLSTTPNATFLLRGSSNTSTLSSDNSPVPSSPTNIPKHSSPEKSLTIR